MSQPRTLPPAWRRWRTARYAELVAAGWPIAWEIAQAETVRRRKLATIIGVKAAREAEMLCRIVDGKPRFFLTGSLDKLGEEQVDRLGEIAGVDLALKL